MGRAASPSFKDIFRKEILRKKGKIQRCFAFLKINLTFNFFPRFFFMRALTKNIIIHENFPLWAKLFFCSLFVLLARLYEHFSRAKKLFDQKKLKDHNY